MWSVPRRVEPWMSHTNQVVKLEWSTTFKTFQITDLVAHHAKVTNFGLQNSSYKCYSCKPSGLPDELLIWVVFWVQIRLKRAQSLYIYLAHSTLVHIRERGFYLFPRPLLSKPSLAFVIVTCRISFTKKDLTVRLGRPPIWLLTRHIFRLNILSFVSSWTAKSQPVGVITFVLGVTSWAKQNLPTSKKYDRFYYHIQTVSTSVMVQPLLMVRSSI